MIAVEVGLPVTRDAERDEVHLVIVGLVVVDVMHCQQPRAVGHHPPADLAGVAVPTADSRSQASAELTRPRAVTLTVDESGVAGAFPASGRLFALSVRPEGAHLLARLWSMAPPAHRWLGFALLPRARHLPMPFGAHVGWAQLQRDAVTRWATLPTTSNGRVAVDATPFLLARRLCPTCAGDAALVLSVASQGHATVDAAPFLYGDRPQVAFHAACIALLDRLATVKARLGLAAFLVARAAKVRAVLDCSTTARAWFSIQGAVSAHFHNSQYSTAGERRSLCA